ncbi:hypothetical protein OJF2_73920 [Aquisphaera giovannonii]|uniref:Uncharacterized protein n=1 Tax=Aquisphaera giovannonii TaxID=406548 RepID=A0A5B9WEX7_9BACT|nr:hypothetical protein [Aquisphaera giovannonii]QEH38784.1 hypothetical protein OJF2_73920 [Aquisphaera giovannonii]
MNVGTLWRQGDILIQRIESVPPAAQRLRRPVLASGDTTGHSHRIEDRRTARLLLIDGAPGTQLFLEVDADEASVVHPEHDTITLPRGAYRVWRQREFDDRGSRPVSD